MSTNYMNSTTDTMNYTTELTERKGVSQENQVPPECQTGINIVDGTLQQTEEVQTRCEEPVGSPYFSADAVNLTNNAAGIKDIAARFRQWGLNTIPSAKDGKRPQGIWDANQEKYIWKPFQVRLSSDGEWEQWEMNGYFRIGIVCGKISGNLLVLDFDMKGKVFEAFMEKLSAELRDRLVIERSPSGGYHIYVRSEQPVGGNEKLAQEWDADQDELKELIETRGEGGYIICDPSPGYELIQGSFDNIPVLTPAEIEMLLDVAKSFDNKPDAAATTSQGANKPKTKAATEQPNYRQDILAAMDIRKEFTELGIKLTGESNADGWITCHAFDREDKNPSAGVNIKTGDYKDHGGSGKSMSIFDVWMRLNGKTFNEALKHYGNKTGIFKKKPSRKKAKKSQKKQTQGTEYASEFCEKLLNDLQVVIFGQDEERRIHGFSYNTKRRFVIKDRNRYTFLDLIGDCGQLVDDYVVEYKNTDEDNGMDKDKGKEADIVQYSMKEVRDVFVREASKHIIYDSDLRGQGIWLDPQTQHAVIVFGGGQAAVWNGTTLERLTKPFYGDMQLDLQTAHSEFADFDMLKSALENYDESKARTAFAELKNLIMQWNWKTRDKDATVTLIAALAAASLIQSVFKFRPQVCISGETGSGKSSILLDLFIPLFGGLKEYQQKPSAAGIRQSVGGNSRVFMIDELERNKHRDEIMKQLRTSTDGGYIVMGTAQQKPIKFGMKHIVWIASIEMNLANLADASRFFKFEPKRPKRIDGKRPLLKLDPQAIKRIGFDLIVFAVKNMQSLLQLVKTLSEADIAEASPRNIESAAVPAAFAEQLCGWTREATHNFMHAAIHGNSPQQSTDVTEDHDDLLQTILSQIIRVNTLGEQSVIQAIRKAAAKTCSDNVGRGDATEALERNGIILIKPRNVSSEATEGAGIRIDHYRDLNRAVFFHPGIVAEVLLKSTNWRGTDIKQLLDRCVDAKKHCAKYNGKPTKGICMPLATILGVENEKQDEEVLDAA